ncbi:hypothetical protein [Planctomicrobium sp. SH664]|uniref:hypothetical protein n=1 Tax=Planctomicrobium sp. SH664 TaxID=3448125 RepID=UPI003F5C4B98
MLFTGEAPRLSREQQSQYLQLLARGASPAAACLQLGISPLSVTSLTEDDDSFRSSLAGIQRLMSENVAAALYRAAMEGSVAAQTFYLKNQPPPEWPAAECDAATPGIDELTDDELIAKIKQAAPELLAADGELAAATTRSP